MVFGLLDDTFFEARNFTNLLLQMAATATIAIGVVFVLLIGEIDLSVAYVSAVGGVVAALLLRPGDPGWPWWLVILIALTITTTIGLLQSLIITKAGVPSFVVTLAGLLIWNGVVLYLTVDYSTRRHHPDPGPAPSSTSPTTSSATPGGGRSPCSSWRPTPLRRSRRPARVGRPGCTPSRRRSCSSSSAGWPPSPSPRSGTPTRDRGVPTVTLILAVLLVFWSFVASRLRFGRHVYAVGGNAEAARRAGINVDRVRILVFMISGFMAGVGGIMLASRARSVATGAGGGNLLLTVIAAAVIGGTSLFGGNGRVVSALLGALVIASIENGMGLLGLPQGTKFIITGLVLLGAVLVDALSKRSRASRGIN